MSPTRLLLAIFASCLLLPVSCGAATLAVGPGPSLSPASAASAASGADRPFDVIGYTATLDPDMTAQSIQGIESIDLAVTTAETSRLQFGTGSMSIDSVSLRGRPLKFTVADKKLVVMLPAPAKRGKKLRLALRYHGSPRHGLEFHPEAAQLYTVFSTSEWLVSIDAPDERATLDLSVLLPEDYRAVGNAPLVSRKKAGAGRVAYRWRQREPIPGFAYGFAAGRFNEVESSSKGIRLRFVSRTLDEAQARRLFANTGDMLAFFAERSGVAYRGKYDQVLVTKTIGQEVGSYALLSEEYGAAALAGTDSEELIAHELAHQWWGIGITCRSWGEFWLNEGFANFMAAAYMQRKHGDADYQAAVERWRKRLDKLRSEGKDHALVYASWKPTRDDRAVVYQKGAYVLHLLRQELGEAVFWKAMRDYSRQYPGSSVTTTDFKSAVERSSGRNLDAFFEQWVFAGG